MKKTIALLLALVMAVSGCGSAAGNNTTNDDTSITGVSTNEESAKDDESGEPAAKDEVVADETTGNNDPSTDVTKPLDIDDYSYETKEIDFKNLNDTELLQYVQDSVYADLEESFQSDDYVIDEVKAIYISKEYIEELEYNSKSNIFFGYTLAELDEQFQGKKYVFTLGDNGETTVIEFQNYDDTYDRALRNIAIGTGVILICVTVSVVTGGLGAPAVSVVFAASAKTGTTFALSSGIISALTAGVIEGYRTGDFEAAKKAAALAGSEAFKWGAITGAVTGGIVKTQEINTIRTPEQSEQAALEAYKGRKQVTYRNGKEVGYGEPGGTRPDIVRTIDDHLEAIEVKNYDLNNEKNVRSLLHELKRQVAERVANMPEGTTQRIVLDVRGRKYPKELVEKVIRYIQNVCGSDYPNIPVDLLTI